MIECFLFVLIIILIYFNWCYSQDRKQRIAKENEGSSNKKDRHILELLFSLKGRTAEIALKEPRSIFDYEPQKKVAVIDVDSEWVLFALPKRKENLQMALRVSMISDVREIKD